MSDQASARKTTVSTAKLILQQNGWRENENGRDFETFVATKDPADQLTIRAAYKQSRPRESDNQQADRKHSVFNTAAEYEKEFEKEDSDAKERAILRSATNCYVDTVPIDGAQYYFFEGDDLQNFSQNRCWGCIYFGNDREGKQRYRRCTLDRVGNTEFCRTHRTDVVDNEVKFQDEGKVEFKCTTHGLQLTREAVRCMYEERIAGNAALKRCCEEAKQKKKTCPGANSCPGDRQQT